MTIWEKVTGSDITKEMKGFETRIKTLPQQYQEAWNQMKETIYPYSDLTGRNLIPIFDGIVCLLEEANIDHQSIEDIFGDDMKGFCLALLGEEGAKDYRDKWRDKLNNSVKKKLQELEDK